MGCRYWGPSSDGSVREDGDTGHSSQINWIQLDPTMSNRLPQGTAEPWPGLPQLVPAGSSRFQPPATGHSWAPHTRWEWHGGKRLRTGKITRWQRGAVRKKKQIRETTLGTLRWEKELGKMVHVLEEKSPCSLWGEHDTGGVSQQPVETPTQRQGKCVTNHFYLAINVIVPTLSLFCLW